MMPAVATKLAPEAEATTNSGGGKEGTFMVAEEAVQSSDRLSGMVTNALMTSSTHELWAT